MRALGRMETKELTLHESEMISQHYNEVVKAATIFKRLQRRNEILFSEQYSRVKVRNSYTVLYRASSGMLSYGQILYFVCLRNKPAAVIKQLQHLRSPEDFQPAKAIVPVTVSPIMEVVNVADIQEKCVFLCVSDVCYVINFPCSLDID